MSDLKAELTQLVEAGKVQVGLIDLKSYQLCIEAITRAITAEEKIKKPFNCSEFGNADGMNGSCHECDALDVCMDYKHLQSVDKRIKTQIATLTEENDIQRASIQQLSRQVAGLRDGLVEVKYTIESMVPAYLDNPSEFKFTKLSIGQVSKIIKLLSSPDPGEKYRALFEGCRQARQAMECWGEGSVYAPILKALDDLERARNNTSK